MARPEAAYEHYERQRVQAEETVRLATKRWQLMSPDDLERSWAQIVGRLAIMVASGMLGAAKAGASYVSEALDDDTSAGLVAAATFARTASDGRSLDTLLYSAVVRTRGLLAQGKPALLALSAGEKWLSTLTRTQVADAGRGAAGVAIAATPRAGYVRLVSAPCCPRCAVLSGKYFRWNAGFQRHPGCDCRHMPAHEGTSPSDLTAPIRPDQVRGLTLAQRQAVADGADLAQIANAHRRGNRSQDGMTTTEGTTRRGYASYVRRTVAAQRGQLAQETVERSRGARNVTRIQNRLTPAAIYRVAATREEAVRLLALNGYIVGDIGALARRLA